MGLIADTPLSTSFIDYHLPPTTETPNMVVRHFQSPAPTMQ